MSNRHKGRKLAIQALYQTISRSADINTFIDLFIDENEADIETKKWAKELALNAFEKQTESDELIKQYAINWDIKRISIIDLSILRLAFFELTNNQTPAKVIANEAIELAKEFSTDESPKFINGIIGKYIKENVYGNN